jgi:hypothetical protein
MDVLDLSYKVKDNQVLEAVYRQQFGIQYPVYHIPCDINERLKILLAMP